MSWNICDLDKSKTEQSIVNENIRLDQCRSQLNALTQERDRYKNAVDAKLNDYQTRIDKLTLSITAGEQFVKDCEAHLNDFE